MILAESCATMADRDDEGDIGDVIDVGAARTQT